VDVGSVYDNRIDLKVEDKIIASGELVIINDRYGVKINEIFTEEKNKASEQQVQYAEESYNVPPAAGNTAEPQYEQESEAAQREDDTFKEEDFDYSDFDIDEDDI
jgi:hypothetical protein